MNRLKQALQVLFGGKPKGVETIEALPEEPHEEPHEPPLAALNAAVKLYFTGMHAMSATFQDREPEAWPINFLSTMASIQLQYLVSWPEGEEVMKLYGQALGQTYAMLSGNDEHHTVN